MNESNNKSFRYWKDNLFKRKSRKVRAIVYEDYSKRKTADDLT